MVDGKVIVVVVVVAVVVCFCVVVDSGVVVVVVKANVVDRVGSYTNQPVEILKLLLSTNFKAYALTEHRLEKALLCCLFALITARQLVENALTVVCTTGKMLFAFR